MKKIILYTTHCPRCGHLEYELNRKKIKYDVVDDVTKMLGFGLLSTPMLEVNGKTLNYEEALQYIRSKN